MNKEEIRLGIRSEFGRLRSVIVKRPVELDLLNIEETQRNADHYESEKEFHPEDESFNLELVIGQLEKFQELLRSNGVRLLYVTHEPSARYQLFTRDLGFVVDNNFFFSRMCHDCRKVEYEGLNRIKGDLGSYSFIGEGTIEGGDIFINGTEVFVGLSSRTNKQAYKALQQALGKKGYSCIPVPLKKGVLHLDCRFNIISLETAVVYGDDISGEGMHNLGEHFKKIIRGPASELATLGPNYFIVNPRLAAVEKRNNWTIEMLGNQGYEVVPLDFSEVNKLWGSLRCTTLPLHRD